MTLNSAVSFKINDLEWQRNIQWHEAARGLSVTVELLVELTVGTGQTDGRGTTRNEAS